MGDAYTVPVNSVLKKRYKNTCVFLGIIVAYMTISPVSIYSSSSLELLSYVAFCIIAFSLCRKEKVINIKDRNAIKLCFICFIFAFIVPIIIHRQMPFTTDVLQWVSIFLIVSLEKQYREKILNVAVSIVSVIVFCAVIEYIISYSTGWSITLTTLEHGEVTFTHSFFNLYMNGDLHNRFRAISNEPGALGALCGFMVGYLPFGKKYKNKIVIFLIAGLLSLSLAFYIYFIFIVIFKLITRQIGFKILIILLTSVAAMAYFFREPIQQAVIERVLYKDNVDNRTGDTANKFMDNLFTTSETFYGVGNRTAYKIEEGSGQGNAGLKWKIFQYGVVGVGFYFLGMYFLYRRFRNENVSLFFGIIFFLLYFYSVGSWGIPIFMLLLFTTLPINNQKTKNRLKSVHNQLVLN